MCDKVIINAFRVQVMQFNLSHDIIETELRTNMNAGGRDRDP